MTTATLTSVKTTVHITWTNAPKVRMTAKVDMPEYGLKAEQVFYLVRSSADDGTYYIVTWNYTAIQWTCPCKHSVERPNARQCPHRRLVNADCKARREAKQAAAQRIGQALDILAEEHKEAAKALRQQEGLVQAPNGNWVTPEQLAHVPGAPHSTYEAARAQAGTQEIVARLSRMGFMRR